MEKYSKYKDSGIEWLGVIPAHWKVNRLKNVLSSSLKYGANEPAIDDNPNNPRYIRITDFAEDDFLRKETFKSLEYNKAKDYLLKEGDILFARSGATVGKTFHFKKYNGLACFAGYLIKATPDKNILSSDFLSYFTKTIKYDEWKKNSFIQSTIQNISAEKYGLINLPVPPLSEQQAIATYLDKKTQAIDKKVSLLERKISYYKELRKALINTTVTKGLNPNTPLKDSGIDWIGQIPEHWEVKRVKEFGHIETSSVNKKIEDDEEIVKLINYTDVYDNPTKEIWNKSSYMRVSAKNNQIAFKSLKKGDVLFTPSSETIEDIGVSSVVMEDLTNTLYSYHLLRLRFDVKVALSFKKYMLNNDFVQSYMSCSATGTTRKILGLNTVYNTPVVFLPTLNEQTAIANYLDEKTSKIDAIVSNIEQQIEKAKELRKTLINDVVTGKIKVV